MHAGERAGPKDATRALVAQADRWQCARGVDSTSFSDLLSLLSEALRLPDGWGESVLAPLKEASAQGHPELTFAQFCAVVCEARAALDELATAAEQQQPADQAEGGGGGTSGASAGGAGAGLGRGLLAPLLALQGPVRTNMSDESFANPLRHLAAGEGRPHTVLGGGASDDRAGLSWVENCGMDLDAGLARAQQLTELVHDRVHAALITPLVDLSETVDPLVSLPRPLRALIPEWQVRWGARALAC